MESSTTTPSTLRELVLSDYAGNIIVDTHFLFTGTELNPNGTITVIARNGCDVEHTFEASAPIFGTNDPVRPDRLTVVDSLGEVVSFDFL